MPKYRDRCRTTTVTTGTGNCVLSGTAPDGYQSPITAGVYAANERFPYCIALSTEWETGVGYHNGTSLIRETPIEGSAGLATLVNFSAGTKDVFCGPLARVQYAHGRNFLMRRGIAAF